MAILVMIVRKMLSNRWLEISLLFGLTLAVALTSSIPMYTEAILHRMLLKDLEHLQSAANEYPGWHNDKLLFGKDMNKEARAAATAQIDRFLREQTVPGFGLPVQEYAVERISDAFDFEPADPAASGADVSRIADVAAISGIEPHIRLIDGRLPGKKPIDGVYEAMVTDSALGELKMVLGEVFRAKAEDGMPDLLIKPVGVIDRKSYDDPYWQNDLAAATTTFFIDYELFESDFTPAGGYGTRGGEWDVAFDYTKLKVANIRSLLEVNDRTEDFMSGFAIQATTHTSALTTLNNYLLEEQKLRVMLWSLHVPVLFAIAYYLVMTANRIVERQKAEIAVLRSRGAARWQIMLGYIIEGLLLTAVAGTIGPFAGEALTRMLGASDGFLHFVQRTALQVELSREAFLYGWIAAFSSVALTLLPAFFATRATIVTQKQQASRLGKRSFLHRYFLDPVMVGAALYGLYSYNRKLADLKALGLDSLSFHVDPMLFVLPALFILGAGVLVLRVYPLLVALLYRLGRRWWPPALYATLLQVSRSLSQYHFIMVFLSLTIATGLFSASAARTLSRNTEDQIRYAGGADVVLQVEWENDAPPPALAGAPPPPVPGGADTAASGPGKVHYVEPPFEPLRALPSVEHAAKVFVKDKVSLSAGNASSSVTLMGIDTDDFGYTAWMKPGVLAHPFYDYLNVLAPDPTGVLISKTIADERGLKPGDPIQLSWNESEQGNFIVYAVIDYWPSWNPNSQRGGDGKLQTQRLVVGHLSAVQNSLALEPYEVWLKLKPNASSAKLYEELAATRLPITDIRDTAQQLIASRNDPFQLAIGGVMTLGFLIITIMAFCGFLLFWILSLSGRILQFGTFRAMGLSVRQLIGMIVAEQLLTSGAAFGIGIAIGQAASFGFVPLFRLAYDPSAQVPPFQVAIESGDRNSLILIVVSMMAVGSAVLAFLLTRIQLHQAIKLGED